MTCKTLIAEFRSRTPEKAIVDEFIKRLWLVVFAALVVAYHFLGRFAGKYVPAIRSYFFVPSFPWVFGVLCIVVGGTLIYGRFTIRGRRSQLRYLLHRLREYKRFSHEKEMEIVSRIHSRTRGAALIFLVTLFLTVPLAIAISYWFGVAIIVDITNNVKGTHTRIQPTLGSKLFFHAYGIALGVSFYSILRLLESSREDSLLLSGKYRRKMIYRWQTRIITIKLKPRKHARKQALAQNASASA